MKRIGFFGAIGALALFAYYTFVHDWSTPFYIFAGDWRKPFSRGGPLSVDKPFDKGGGLSIDKVYVPQKLRIGKVKTIAEVIIPVCWGSPQDCRGVEPAKAKDEAGKMIKDYPYYLTGRFICRNRTNHQLSGKQCDVTKGSSRSCVEALNSLESHVGEFGDPCVQCADISDPSQYWDGAKIEHIQGGPCAGM